MTELQLPLFDTPTEWRLPTELPDPKNLPKLVSLDTEGRDDMLGKELGPGYVHGAGYLCGLSLAWYEDTALRSLYLPFRHLGGDNLDENIVKSWAKEVFADPSREVIGINNQFDKGWMLNWGVPIRGTMRDIQIGDALCDEEHPDGYSLDSIARRRVGRGKSEEHLRDAARNFGVDPKSGLWKLPARYVGNYAVEDAILPLLAYPRILKDLEAQNLMPSFELETQVMPVLFKMHWNGVRVDLNYAQDLHFKWSRDYKHLLNGLKIDSPWEAEQIGKRCDQLGLKYPRTEKTAAPSFRKEFLETAQDDHQYRVNGVDRKGFFLGIREARTFDRLLNTYLKQNILEGHRHGRVHSRYIQIASDEGGTRTRRLASAGPNIQQIPKRSKLMDAKALRKAYLPEPGEQWARLDYRSQEPTMQVHYGIASKVGGEYTQSVKAFMEAGNKIYKWIEEGTGLDYDTCKQCALGRAYGMGIKKMAADLGLTRAKCKEVLETFDTRTPFIGEVARNANAKAAAVGFIRTILGGRRHFNLWEPWKSFEERNNDEEEGFKPLRFEEAKARWPGKRLVRFGTRKAYNSLIQGSCAEQTKISLVCIDKVLSTPLMTVHDEISKSVSGPAEAEKIRNIMENALPQMKIRVFADLDLGASWK